MEAKGSVATRIVDAQAIQERLSDVTIVSPQSPSSSKEWNWRYYVKYLGAFLKERFGDRRKVAIGFSRGGRGVLQTCAVDPLLISKWALVDPQRADSDEEEALLAKGPNESGWLRFGNAIPLNTPLAARLGERLRPNQPAFVDLAHNRLAIAAFSGEKLHGSFDMQYHIAANDSAFARFALPTPQRKPRTDRACTNI